MKTYFLQQHAFYCNCHESKRHLFLSDDKDDFKSFYKSLNLMCERMPEKMLFYHNNDFYLIIFNSCMTNDKYGFLVDILKDSFVSKEKKYVHVSKSNVYDKIYKQLKDEKRNLKNLFTEVNFIYSDNAAKMYCIESVVPFENIDFDNEILRKNYQDSKNEIIEKHENCKFLLNELEKLFYANCIPLVKETFVIKTTEELIKQINKLSK